MNEYTVLGLIVLTVVLVGGAIWWDARSKRKPKSGEKTDKVADHIGAKAGEEHPPPAPLPLNLPELPEAEKKRLEQAASMAFEAAVSNATDRFGKKLDETSGRLSELITRLTTGIVEKELEQYRASVEDARKTALASLANVQTTVDAQQQTLKTDIDKALGDRRRYLLERLDKRLGEAVSAYLVDSLGQAADLGAQRAFLLESLERHKADLKSEFGDET